MKILGGYRLCVPFFEQDTDPNVSVSVQTTEPPAQDPPPTPDNKHLEIGVQVGQLQAKVEELQAKVEVLTANLEAAETAQRWTREDLSSLWSEMWVTRQEVTETLEEIKEEQTEEAEEVVEQIPAIPAAAPQPQGEPEPEKKRRPWFL